MVIELDIPTLAAGVASICGVWWALARMLLRQYDKRQDERFAALATQGTELKTALDKNSEETSRKNDEAINEMKRIEREMLEFKADAASRFITKEENSSRHKEILDAIGALARRIDRMTGAPSHGHGQ